MYKNKLYHIREVSLRKGKEFIAVLTAIGLVASSVTGYVSCQTEPTQIHAQVMDREADGYVEPVFKYPYIDKEVNPEEGRIGCKLYGAESLPASYNTDVNNLQYVSEVKDQGQTQTCWAFASNGILESALMKQNHINSPSAYDFSENHMRYALSYQDDNRHGFDRLASGLGNVDMAIAYWSRGVNGYNGPVSEANDPFSVTSTMRTDADISSKQAEDYYVSHVVTLADLPTNYNSAQKQTYINDVKKMVYNYGSVSASYYETSGSGYNCNPQEEHENVSYYSNVTSTNHAVCIVGWNDTYQKENFSSSFRPPHDGAFLVKNSWGQQWGMSGYFWMSYDSWFENIKAIAKVNSRSQLFDHIYEYDEFGLCGYMGTNTNSCCYLNSFTTTDSDQETLTAAATYCLVPGSYFEVYVDRDNTDTVAPELVEIKDFDKCANGYYVGEAGYVTFELQQPVDVSPNFDVIIKVSDHTTQPKIPTESRVGGHTINAVNSNKSKIGTSLSSLRPVTSCDVCIKAFTKEQGQQTAPQPQVKNIISGVVPQFTQYGTAGNMECSTAGQVITRLPNKITAILEGNTYVEIPVHWVDEDYYDANTPGSYTFTAVFGTLPRGVGNAYGVKISIEVLVPVAPSASISPSPSPSPSPSSPIVKSPVNQPVPSQTANPVNITIKDIHTQKAVVRILNKDKNNRTGMLFCVSNYKKSAQVKIDVNQTDDLNVRFNQTVYVYLVNTKTGKLESMKRTKQKVQPDGTIKVDILKDGNYIILKQHPSRNVVASLIEQVKANRAAIKLKTNKTALFKIQIPKTLELVSSLNKKTSHPGKGAVTVSYKSSNPKVAQVNKKGTIKGKKRGTAIITATIKLYDGSKKTYKKRVTIK